jgi:hypothetical protein
MFIKSIQYAECRFHPDWFKVKVIPVHISSLPYFVYGSVEDMDVFFSKATF